MNPELIGRVVSWIQVLNQLYAAGKPAIDAVRTVLRDHGIDADNALLDEAAADAARRKVIAEREASPATPAPNAVHANSPGD